jgi:NAD(P)-dependent dehydrogenase (short-subunit alcohol dehydrogenase family)
MRVLSEKRAVVTGAGSGIGRATALALAHAGCRLALCDVNEEALAAAKADVESAGTSAGSWCVDVSDRRAVAVFAQSVKDEMGPIDILVNSAGVYISGSAAELTLEDWDWVISVNLWGVIHTGHFFLPQLLQGARGGHIVNLVSMYGYWPSPCVAGYLTSKFGVFGYSRALREDLRAHGIGVSTVCPGIVNTGLVHNMRIRHTGHDAQDLRSSLEGQYAARNYGPDKVATAIVNAIRRNRDLVLVTPESRLMYQVERFCPPLSRFIARRAAKRMLS